MFDVLICPVCKVPQSRCSTGTLGSVTSRLRFRGIKTRYRGVVRSYLWTSGPSMSVERGRLLPEVGED